MKASVKDRLLSRIKIDKRGCWVWQSCTNSAGYGQIKINCRQTRAHRASYSEFVGPIPGDIYVCHKCDNPSCINPDHLFLGTPKENSMDAKEKGRRSLIGERNPKNKLSAQDVLYIKDKAGELSTRDLSTKFNVHYSTIYDIIRGKTWSHLK